MSMTGENGDRQCNGGIHEDQNLGKEIYAETNSTVQRRVLNLANAMMEKAVLLSYATASIAFIVTERNLFAALREWVKKNNSFSGELISCGYCLGHWVAFGLVAIYRPRLFDAWWLLDYFLTALVIAWLAGAQGALT